MSLCCDAWYDGGENPSLGAIERINKFMFAGLTVQNSALLTELLKVLADMFGYLSVSDLLAIVVGMQLRSDGLVTDSSGLQMDEGDSLATSSTDVAAGCFVQIKASRRVDVPCSDKKFMGGLCDPSTKNSS